MSIDITDERLTLCVEAVRAIQGDHTEPKEAYDFIMWSAKNLPQELTDFVGMTGGGRAQVKGLFTRVTYADRSESETEYGYCSTAERISRNILRNWDAEVSVSG